MSDSSDKVQKPALGLPGAWAMAVGGMIGGGIFSTLGVVISVSGHWAAASFLIGGLIALATGQSYSALTRKFDRAGGLYTFLRALGYHRLARLAAWTLIAGYTLTVAVYGFTFGAYAANAFGADGRVSSFAAVAAITVLAGVNLAGAREATIVELVAVWGKLAILLALAGIGLWHWAPERLVLDQDQPVRLLGALVGAGVVFMAYEGFQLLSYDYDEMRDPPHTIGLAMPLAIVMTIVVYMLVALGTPMLVPASEIVGQEEISLAAAGQAAAGTAGLIAVTIAAIFSTASAINATVFATARLAHRAANDAELPKAFARENGAGVPWVGTVLISSVAAVLAVIGGIQGLVEGGSFVFLIVFAAVNAIALQQRTGRQWASWTGFVGSIGAAGALVAYLAGWV